MILAGIDYSMTSPAICVYNTSEALEFKNLRFFNLNSVAAREGIYDNIVITHLKNKDWSCQEERFNKICNWATSILCDMKVDRAVIEGFSMGSTSGVVFDIAENTSLLKQWMWKNRIPFTKPSPTQVKKAFAGKGNVKKEPMVDEFYKRNPGVLLHEILGVTEYKNPVNDLTDSYAILLMDEYFAT